MKIVNEQQKYSYPILIRTLLRIIPVPVLCVPIQMLLINIMIIRYKVAQIGAILNTVKPREMRILYLRAISWPRSLNFVCFDCVVDEIRFLGE